VLVSVHQSGPGPWVAGTALFLASDGALHRLTATARERTGTVWVPVPLVASDPRLRWVLDLRLPSSPDGTSGQIVFRVPRWQWADRITESGMSRVGRPDSVS
jgi:hypothetical protein